MNPDPDTLQRLLALGRQVAAERGWSWREPVDVRAAVEQGEPAWVLRTHHLMRGSNVRLVFRRSDLALLDAGWLPR